MKAFIRRRAAEAVRENSETSRSAAGSASAATDPPPGTRPTPDRPAYVPSTIEAISTSVEQLLLTPGLRPLFTSGLILVHNKRPAADQLVSLAVDTLAEFARFREVQISRSKIDDLLPPPNARPSRAQRRRILLVDADGSIEAAGQVVAAHAAIHARRGLWVRTHLDDLRATTLRQFDTLFLFDMSAEHLDRIRSVVPVPSETGPNLRNSVSDIGAVSEGVFMLITTESICGSRLPRLHPNPAIIRMRKTDPPLPTPMYAVG